MIKSAAPALPRRVIDERRHELRANRFTRKSTTEEQRADDASGGFITMPGITYYCGSRFALEGISEALGKEVGPLDTA